MERYSTLWGTDKAGVYGRQGASKGLSAFLTNKIGGSNVKDVVGLTEKILSGFKALPGYELETLDNKPLAVVYAPMYLKNKPGMPTTMKGFCALSVNGMENRAGRKESNYAHTFFFSQQEMLSAGEYNYLDLLMGTYQLTARDVKGHRDGTSRINFEQLPAKVSPVRRAQDLPCVVKAIDCIYQNKNVVIVLEEGVSFNRRAMEILTQLYSMMQPALATETGFATYQTVDRIQELSAETNVQVYVVPAGVEVNKLSANKFEVLNLAAGRVVPEQTPLAMTLLDWDKFDWHYRQSAMEHLFAKSSDYLNAEEFVKLSRQFFAQVQDLNGWLTDTSKHGTITSIEALAAEDKTQTGWKLVPWARKAFESKVPALLKNTSLDALNAQNVALVYEYDGTDERLKKLSVSDGSDASARQKAAREFQYGRKLAGINEAVLCQKIWEKAEGRVSPAYKAEIKSRDEKIQNADAVHQKAMADKDAAHAEEITGLNAAHAAELTAAEEAKQTAVAAEKANTAAVQAKLDDADRVWGEKLNKLNADHTAAMAAKDTAHTEAVTKLNADHTAELAAKDTAHTAAMEAAEKAKAAAVAAEAGKTAAVQTKLDQANTQLEEAKKAFAAQGEELSKAKNAAIKRKQKNEAYEAEITRLNNLLIAEGKDPTPPAPPKPKEPTMTMLGVEMPKSAMKVIAIFAAAALIIGAIVSGVIVGLVAGGKEDPVQTTPPTTTTPAESTSTPTSKPTLPPETTVPSETTLPPETTVPTAAEPDVQSVELEDGTVIDLTEILAEARWKKAGDASFDEQDLIDMKNILGTSRTPVCLVKGDDGSIAVYDYTDDSEKAQKLLGILTDDGHTALVQEDFVLVLVSEEALSAGENP